MASSVLNLLLKAPSKESIESIFDACFRHRKDISQVRFTHTMCIQHDDDGEEDFNRYIYIYRRIHLILRRMQI